ncbi:B12-binding domain-containing radical SAM protein [Sedimentibacter sp. MB31-C6]|uniref:B12-binding domain-containing radical SAM protein n=1 Tax=Sedimentibacter sp. MB31-C6 TaxID=3109366 RepID=UPI002DDD2752|nr:DUF4080 domain-containing protein [Sedimentibacter sp. MB36-C1]WSI03929.1 DUF4080 domain-containing protein [Sedimentibacter sp. MB36-C1]
MKTLLVTLDSKFIHTNLAVRYLKNFCKDNNFDIEIKEFTINQNQEYILRQILDVKADIICFSCYIWNIEYIKEIANIIKEANVNVKILFGGPEVSFEIENLMENEIYIDYVIYGEGEITFNEFLKEIRLSNPNFDKINGLAYRDDGRIIVNNCRNLISNLDIVKYPYEEDEQFENKIIYYESSRGCPFNCSFCMSSIDKTIRNFSLNRVKRDLKKLLKTKARQIKFVDRTFNTDYKRSIEIMKFIVENNHNNMRIHFEITADIINEEFLLYISTLPVNMFQFEIGVQSLNEETLREINRHMNIEKLYHVINSIRINKNIHVHLDLIAGLPYENYETFKESFDGIYKLNAEKIQLGFLKVLKGTKIYMDKVYHNIKYRKKAPYEVICTKYITLNEILKLKSIEELVDKYYNEKYFEYSINYILENIYKESSFEFYEDFSEYWQQNDLYKVSHSRKRLYKILYEFIKYRDKLTEKFISALRYDYVFNNQYEELPSYLNKEYEERYKYIKRLIANDDEFRNQFFEDMSKEDKLINRFRIVDIEKDATLFIYKNKENIFNRCETLKINNWIKEYENE